MPKFNPSGGKTERGDLYISFNTNLPKNISRKAKKLLEELDNEL
jgi:DnaJ-class molecular chaperone